MWHVSGTAALCILLEMSSFRFTSCRLWWRVFGSLSFAERTVVTCSVRHNNHFHRRLRLSIAGTDRLLVPASGGRWVIERWKYTGKTGGTSSDRFEVYTAALLKMQMCQDVWDVRQCRCLNGPRRFIALILRISCLTKKVKTLRCFGTYENYIALYRCGLRLPEWADFSKASSSKLYRMHEWEGNAYTGLVGKPSGNTPSWPRHIKLWNLNELELPGWGCGSVTRCSCCGPVISVKRWEYIA